MKYWDKQWHVVRGCTHVSPACDNCWLERQYKRCGWDFEYHGRCDFETIDSLTKNKKPTKYLVLSDLFHEKIKAQDIIYTFEVMEKCPQHTFIVCTKRPERMESVLYGSESNLDLNRWVGIPNVWLGATAENQEQANKRIPHLIMCKPFKLFLSCEPLLGNIVIPQYQLKEIDLVIAGCESGNKYITRPTKWDWIVNLKTQCKINNVPFWVKQLREFNNKIRYDIHRFSTIKKEDLFKSGVV